MYAVVCSTRLTWVVGGFEFQDRQCYAYLEQQKPKLIAAYALQKMNDHLFVVQINYVP